MKKSHLTKILFDYWGFAKFKAPQKEIIEWVMSGKDAIALIPTGGGKSICYQLPSLISEHPVLVISPLISLIDDQIKSLKKRNIACCSLSGDLGQGDMVRLFDNITFGKYKIIFVSPEKLMNSTFQFRLKQFPLGLIAVDEAHCISQWGHDFRPSYLKINILRTTHPDAPFLALTATAGKRIQGDIIKYLNLKNEKIFKTSFYRKNIWIKVQEVHNKRNEVVQRLKSVKEKSIVYTRSRKSTEELSQLLNSIGVSSTYYHGGLSFEKRKENQALWKTGQNHLMVATSAFGMGIDQPDVRMIMHYDLPESIEAYYQEIGRAGRNGNNATALLIYEHNMQNIVHNRIQKSQPSIKEIQNVFKRLRTYFEIALGESKEAVFNFDLDNFCLKYSFKKRTTFEILKLLDQLAIIRLNEKESAFSRLNIDRQIMQHPNSTSPFLKNILRMYSGVIGNDVVIDEFYMAKNLHWTSDKVKEELTKLNDQFILHYMPGGKLTVRYLVSLEDDRTINRFKKIIENQYRIKKEQAYKMLAFAKDMTHCRNQMLMSHFEESIEPCGFCDVCFKKKRNTKKDFYSLEVELLGVLEKSDYSIVELQEQTGSSMQLLKLIIHKLREEKKIELNKKNQYARL